MKLGAVRSDGRCVLKRATRRLELLTAEGRGKVGRLPRFRRHTDSFEGRLCCGISVQNHNKITLHPGCTRGLSSPV
jgi:hypothetical protein